MTFCSIRLLIALSLFSGVLYLLRYLLRRGSFSLGVALRGAITSSILLSLESLIGRISSPSSLISSRVLASVVAYLSLRLEVLYRFSCSRRCLVIFDKFANDTALSLPFPFLSITAAFTERASSYSSESESGSTNLLRRLIKLVLISC